MAAVKLFELFCKECRLIAVTSARRQREIVRVRQNEFICWLYISLADKCRTLFWAGLFEGRLTLTQDKKLTKVLIILV